jgi:hypothetical protein
MGDGKRISAGSAARAAGLSVGFALVVGAASCQGPQPFYRGSNLVTCELQRLECALMDGLTGQCLLISAAYVNTGANLCVDKNASIDQKTVCKAAFCTNDINAPGACTATFVSVVSAPDGVCDPAPAGTPLSSIVAFSHGQRPAMPNEDHTVPLFPDNGRYGIDPGTIYCVDTTQLSALNWIQPPSTDFSRLVGIINMNVGDRRCIQAPPALLFDVVPGLIATGTGGGVTAAVTALRGQAGVAQSCSGGGDVCLTTALDDFHADLADTTVEGVSLTNLKVATVLPAPLATITDPLDGTFLGIPAGELQLRVVGKMNGADTLFSAVNSSPWRVDVSAAAFHISGQLELNNLGPGGSALPITIVADASGTPATAQSTACSAESSLARLFGFEDVQGWTSTQGTLSLVTSPLTQGCGALGVSGQGYIPITGGAFTTSAVTPNAAASVDLFIPGSQPNPSYLGALQMYLSCPSGNVFNQYIGQVELTGKPQNHYSTLRFPLPPATSSTLGRPLKDCSFGFALNVNPTGQRWILDNLRFTP